MKLLEVNSQLKDLVSAGLYKSEDEAIDDALQHLFESNRKQYNNAFLSYIK